MEHEIEPPPENELDAAARKFSNWGRWGEEDELGTVNFITADARARAGSLVRTGEVFSLALPVGSTGPQTGHLGRFNPLHFMLRDGDDAYSRAMPGVPKGIGGSDDVVVLATHSGTHWDALGHMFLRDRMWNDRDCRLVSSLGAEANSIVPFRDRITGRAVLLDFPRYFGVDWCEAGRAVTSVEIEACARAQDVAIERGDIVLLRFGQLAQCRSRGHWGDYAGGDAPGLAFETLEWVHRTEIAGVAADTWGVEVRPNEIEWVSQPWHRIAIPMIGLLVGEMFDLESLADSCAEDRRYEMFFVGNPLPIEGGVGGPANPTAIK